MPHKYYLNQTSIKQWKKDNYCSAKLKAIYIDKAYESIPTESMSKGHYFEYLAIGNSTGGKAPSIPLLKNGSKSIDAVRIEQQADVFKNKTILDYGITIENTQLKLEREWNNEVVLFGTSDFIGTMIDASVATFPIDIIGDLKLTKNIYSQYGDFCWAFPHNMDHTQAYLYKWLFSESLKKNMEFYYFVYDYKPTPEHKIFRKTVGKLEMAELSESIRMAVDRIKHHEVNGFEENPNYENCKNCPLSITCSKFVKAKTIEVI